MIGSAIGDAYGAVCEFADSARMVNVVAVSGSMSSATV